MPWAREGVVVRASHPEPVSGKVEAANVYNLEPEHRRDHSESCFGSGQAGIDDIEQRLPGSLKIGTESISKLTFNG
jgi:hypothetical protein